MYGTLPTIPISTCLTGHQKPSCDSTRGTSIPQRLACSEVSVHNYSTPNLIIPKFRLNSNTWKFEVFMILARADILFSREKELFFFFKKKCTVWQIYSLKIIFWWVKCKWIKTIRISFSLKFTWAESEEREDGGLKERERCTVAGRKSIELKNLTCYRAHYHFLRVTETARSPKFRSPLQSGEKEKITALLSDHNLDHLLALLPCVSASPQALDF